MSSERRIFHQSIFGPLNRAQTYEGMRETKEIRFKVVVWLSNRLTMAVEIREIQGAGDSGHLPGPVRLGGGLNFKYSMRDFRFVSFTAAVSKLPAGCYVASLQYGCRDVPGSAIEFSPGAALHAAPESL